MDKQVCKKCGAILWEKKEGAYHILSEIILEPPILIRCPKCGEVYELEGELREQWRSFVRW